ncbi:MAG TPA: hypothetical protein VNJ02_10980 [Vicinamibacterales bacterium]|nr:hypothetical protein [Vicinamibacterales bacterium]
MHLIEVLPAALLGAVGGEWTEDFKDGHRRSAREARVVWSTSIADNGQLSLAALAGFI